MLILKNLKLKPCPLPGPAHIHPVQLIVRRHTFNLEWKKKSYQDVSLESSYKENFPPPLCEVLHFLLVQTSSCLAAASPGSAAAAAPSSPGSAAAARQVSAAVLDPALAVEEEASVPVVAEQEVFAVAEQEVFAVAAVLGKVLFPGSAAAAGQLLGRWADLLEIPGVALDPVELEVAGPPVHHRVQELTFEVLEV